MKYLNKSGVFNGQNISPDITRSLEVGGSRVSNVIRDDPDLSFLLLCYAQQTSLDPWVHPLMVIR